MKTRGERKVADILSRTRSKAYGIGSEYKKSRDIESADDEFYFPGSPSHQSGWYKKTEDGKSVFIRD